MTLKVYFLDLRGKILKYFSVNRIKRYHAKTVNKLKPFPAGGLLVESLCATALSNGWETNIIIFIIAS